MVMEPFPGHAVNSSGSTGCRFEAAQTYTRRSPRWNSRRWKCRFVSRMCGVSDAGTSSINRERSVGTPGFTSQDELKSPGSGGSRYSVVVLMSSMVPRSRAPTEKLCTIRSE